MTNSETIQEALIVARANRSKDFDLASSACLRVIEIAETPSVEAEVRDVYASVLFSNGDITQAIEQIKMAIALRETTGETAKLAFCLNDLAIYLSEIGNFADALDSSFRSLRILESKEDKRSISVVLINIGSIYQKLKNRTEEIRMYERSLSIATDIGDKNLVAANHLNLGILHTYQGNFEKSLEYLGSLSDLFISMGDKINAVNALNSLGELFFKMGMYDEALEKYFACLELSKQTGNASSLESSLMNIGETKIRQGKADEAKPYIDKAIELAEKSSQRSILKEARLILTEYFASKADYKSAFEEYKRHIEIKDELLNIQNMKQLGELKLKYDIEKKEKESEINHLKNIELKEAFDNLHREKMRSDKLLLNILPEEVAEELKQTGTAKARSFEAVTVMFVDIQNFTSISQELSPEDLVSEIDLLFRGFDAITTRFDIEKIKTIGDAYMCASGIPVQHEKHAENMAMAAMEIVDFISDLKRERQAQEKVFFEVRIGLHSGAVVAGIVGSSKFAYDIWGDTVNTAARMEQTCEVGKINISGDTYLLLKDKFNTTYRGKIYAKNKGEIDMYFLDSRIG